MNTRAATVAVGTFTVKRMGYGAMRLTGDGIWGEPSDLGEAMRVLARAVDLGIDFIDTADSYGPEVSERLIGEAFRASSRRPVVATKAGLTRQGPDRWQPVGRPEYLVQQVEMSLRRLNVERLDLWQLHRIDPLVPLEDSLEAVARLQQEGKIQHVGLCEVTVAEIVEARRILDVVSVQNLYNVATRQHEPVLEYCEQQGLAFIPWFPLGGGDLVGRDSPLSAPAARRGATPSQLCLAWLLHRSPAIVLIPGTSSVAHLEENVRAVDLEISDDDAQEIERAIRE